MNILPVITLYQPWATWIIRGWKTIETRTHDRFKSLEDKVILIHAGQKTDETAALNPYLTKQQIFHNPDEIVNGYILGSVHVNAFGKLNATHSKPSLIDCANTERWGLFLDSVYNFNKSIIPVKGEMGIWYFDLDKMEKVKKPKNSTDSLTLF